MCSRFESHWNRWSLKFLLTFDEPVSLVYNEQAYYVLPLSGIYLCFRIRVTMFIEPDPFPSAQRLCILESSFNNWRCQLLYGVTGPMKRYILFPSSAQEKEWKCHERGPRLKGRHSHQCDRSWVLSEKLWLAQSKTHCWNPWDKEEQPSQLTLQVKLSNAP